MVLEIWCGEGIFPSIQNYWLWSGNEVLRGKRICDGERTPAMNAIRRTTRRWRNGEDEDEDAGVGGSKERREAFTYVQDQGGDENDSHHEYSDTEGSGDGQDNRREHVKSRWIGTPSIVSYWNRPEKRPSVLSDDTARRNPVVGCIGRRSSRYSWSYLVCHWHMSWVAV